MDFREFSEAYNNYLMHAGTNNGVNIGRLTELLKKYKKQSPPEKHSKIDQLSRIVIQQAQNGNLEQAREAAQDFNRIIPGSPSSMLFQAIINELTKPQPTYRMADSVPRPITGKRLSHSNDFREFSEEYNDYLMHAGDRDGHDLMTESGMKKKQTVKNESAVRKWFKIFFPEKDYESFWNMVSKRDYDEIVNLIKTYGVNNGAPMNIVYKYYPKNGK